MQANSGSKPSGQFLSNREIEVLRLLADGLVKKEIADKLNIAYSTVDYQVTHIYAKLDVKNAPAAVNQAYRRRLH